MLELVIYGRADFREGHRAEQLLDYLNRQTDFKPNKFDWGEPTRQPFDESHMGTALDIILNEVGNRENPENQYGEILFKKKKPDQYFLIEWSRRKYYPFSRSVYAVDRKYIQNSDGLPKWIEFSIPLLHIHDAYFACMGYEEEMNEQNSLQWDDTGTGKIATGYVGTKLHENIPGIYWCNYFNAFYIGWLGEAKFNALPCVIKRKVGSGILFTIAEKPEDWSTPETRVRKKAIYQQLGKEAFFIAEEYKEAAMNAWRAGKIEEPMNYLYKRKVPDFPFWSMPVNGL